jgi:galactose-1-phosphate uridylyltransferase
VAVNANYLFPAGATLVHPHLQLLVTPEPFTHHENLMRAGDGYYRNHGTPYFLDLVSEEKALDLRYVAQRGRWHWMAAFSPMGMNEFIAIHEDTADFGNLTDADLEDLSYGISRVLHLYGTLGYLSFNYSLMSVRALSYRQSWRCLMRIINRQNLYLNYRNDDYFLQKLLQSDFIINPPEDLAKQLREWF